MEGALSAGLADVHGRDIPIRRLGQTVAALDEGHPVSRTVRPKATGLLAATGRTIDG